MKELVALQGIFGALQQITTGNGYLTDAGERVSWLQDAYDSATDLPLIVLTPEFQDETVAIGPESAAEFRIAASLVVEGHIETTADDLTPIYALWHDIVAAVMAWRPEVAADAIQIEYRGKSIHLPAESGAGSVAFVQVRFGIVYTDSFL